MKWNELKENWPSVRVEVKHKWGKFTEEDLFMISGQRESFVRLFEMRYGEDEVAAGFSSIGLGISTPGPLRLSPTGTSTLAL